MFEKVNENFVCRAVAQDVYYTTNFVIDLGKVDVSDITVDGVIYHSQACPSSLIYINKENRKICTKAETNSSEIFDVYKLKCQYSKSFSKTLKEYILKWKIVKFEADSDKLCKYAVIKYKSCSETENMNSNGGTFQQPHENSKKRREPYIRTFPSVMKKIKSIGSVSAPTEVVSKIQVMAGGAFNLSSASEVARIELKCTTLWEILVDQSLGILAIQKVQIAINSKCYL